MKLTHNSIKRLTISLVLVVCGGELKAAPFGFATDFDASTLYQVDLGVPSATPIGPIGFANVTGLALQPGTGTLFGVDHDSDQLLTINKTTGMGTAVGALGFDLFDVGLAFDASGNLFMSRDTSGDFYSVNPVSGQAAFIGNTQTDGVVGLAFSSNGTLFGLNDTPGNQLVTINTGNGLATPVGPLGLSTNAAGIDFDPSGVLWGVFGFVNPGVTTINTTTGQATTPIDLGITFAGLAIVPEHGSLALTAIGLLSLSGLLRRRTVCGSRDAVRP